MEAYNGNKPYIFISYSHADEAKMLPLAEKLNEEGYRIWYDTGIHAGDEWKKIIFNRIEECSFFICLVSENSLNSIHCAAELDTAVDLYNSEKRPVNILIFMDNGLNFRSFKGTEFEGSLLYVKKYQQLYYSDSVYKDLMKAKGIEKCRRKQEQEEEEEVSPAVPVITEKKAEKPPFPATNADDLSGESLGQRSVTASAKLKNALFFSKYDYGRADDAFRASYKIYTALLRDYPESIEETEHFAELCRTMAEFYESSGKTEYAEIIRADLERAETAIALYRENIRLAQEAERLAAEEAERKRLEEERLAAEEAERKRLEEERLAAEEAERKRLEEERLAAEEAERKRLEEERLAAEEAERKRLEEERLAAEEAEKMRLVAEEARKKYIEEKRLAAEEAEKERLAAEEMKIKRLKEEIRTAKGLKRKVEVIEFYAYYAQKDNYTWRHRVCRYAKIRRLPAIVGIPNGIMMMAALCLYAVGIYIPLMQSDEPAAYPVKQVIIFGTVFAFIFQDSRAFRERFYYNLNCEFRFVKLIKILLSALADCLLLVLVPGGICFALFGLPIEPIKWLIFPLTAFAAGRVIHQLISAVDIIVYAYMPPADASAYKWYK